MAPSEHHQPTYDAVVIGGGPAGLQTALTLGRMRRHTLLLDSGSYRNERAGHIHNFAGFEGTPPEEYRAAARRDLAAYSTVETRTATASSVKPDGDLFVVEVDGAPVHARRVVLATGLRDRLPEHPGLAELWGTVAAQCAYCHGHEYAGAPVAVLGSSANLPLMLASIADRVTLLADGVDLDPDSARIVEAAGIEVRTERVEGFERTGSGCRVTLADGPAEEVAGVFIGTTGEQAAPFAEQLELELNPSGGIRVDPMGRTSLPGVYAAGDSAHASAFPLPPAAVLTAAAAGLVAATGVIADLLSVDHGVDP